MEVSEEIRSEQPRASVLSIASIVASMACVGIGVLTGSTRLRFITTPVARRTGVS